MSDPAIAPTPTPTPAPATRSQARRVAANAILRRAHSYEVLMLGYGIVQYRLIGGGAFALGDYFLAGLVFMYTGTIADWLINTAHARWRESPRHGHRG